MKAGWGSERVERFFAAPSDGYRVDEEGFLVEPSGKYGEVLNSKVIETDVLAGRRCLVILGEPGSGKTSILNDPGLLLDPSVHCAVLRSLDLAGFGSEDRLERKLLDDPAVKSWRESSHGELCLLLDSFDECRVHVAQLTTFLSDLLDRLPTQRLYLRICCRTSNWPQSFEQSLRRQFDDVAVVELLPLRRCDVENLSTKAGVSGEKFVAAVQKVQAGPLAVRPLTLSLLVSIFQNEGALPANLADLYKRAVLLMCEEPNPDRRDAATGLDRDYEPAQLVAVNARIAAMLTLGNYGLIWTGPPSEQPDSGLAIGACLGGAEPAGAGSAPVDKRVVKAALGSGVWNSQGKNSLGAAHRTFLEFLTATYMTTHSMSSEQVTDLLVAEDGLAYPQRRAIAAWLLALRPSEFGWFAEQDPELFLDVSVDPPDDATKERVVAGLLRRAAEGRFDRKLGQRLDGLRHAGLIDQIRPALVSGSAIQRRLAVDIAGDCGLVDLRKDLVGIITDPANDYYVRLRSAYALLDLAAEVPTTELRDLALAPVRDDDPDDCLKGVALRLSWPAVVTTAEVLEGLASPKENLIGAYFRFVKHQLPNGLSAADVPVVLKWLLDVERSGRPRAFDLLADRVVGLAIEQVDDEAIATQLAELIVQRFDTYEGLYLSSDTPSHSLKPLTSTQRRQLLKAVLPLVTADTATMLFELGIPLATVEDLEWLIAEYDSAQDFLEPIGSLIVHLFHPDNPGHSKLVLELPQDHPIRTTVLRFWLEPVDLEQHRTLQEERERKRRQRAAGRSKPDLVIPTDEEIERSIVDGLDDFEGGNVDAFWRLCFYLYVDPGKPGAGSAFEIEPDVTSQPRWAVLSPDLQERLARASRRYLELGNCSPAAWLGKRLFHKPAWAGYRALILQLRLDPDVLSDLQPEIWQKWAPIILAFLTNGEDSPNDQTLLLQTASNHASNELFQSATQLITDASERDKQLYKDDQLAAIWSEELTNWLLDALSNNKLSGPIIDETTKLLAKSDIQSARPYLQQVLATHTDEDRQAQAGALLLAHDPAESWQTVRAVLHEHPDLGTRIVYRYLDTDDGRFIPELPETDLADLYLWTQTRFPHDDDPQFDDAHIVGPREQASMWRDSILTKLQRLGTPAAVEAIRSIETTLPEQPWLSTIRREAETKLRTNQCPTVTPSQLLQLTANHDQRLITTESQLTDLVLQALDEVQGRLTTGSPPEAPQLWDTTIHRPKDEDEISNYLCNRLSDLLTHSGTVINREVQIRPSESGKGRGEQVDLLVDATHIDQTPPTLRVPVEVKGGWHRHLLAALNNQLVDRYMKDLRATHGIYLVIWPDLDSWTHNEDRRTRFTRRDRGKIQAKLEDQASALPGHTVKVVFLNISLARPQTMIPSASQ